MPGKPDHRARGAAVEAAARAHLLRAGLREVAANVNYRGGELDLVMLEKSGLEKSGLNRNELDTHGRDGDCLVFVEVRYRSHAGFGGGAASVDARKRRKLVLAAQLFLAGHRKFANMPCRFDVIHASGDPQAPQLQWLRDAFRADDV